MYFKQSDQSVFAIKKYIISTFIFFESYFLIINYVFIEIVKLLCYMCSRISSVTTLNV